jgi:hypothetical protein
MSCTRVIVGDLIVIWLLPLIGKIFANINRLQPDIRRLVISLKLIRVFPILVVLDVCWMLNGPLGQIFGTSWLVHVVLA